ncbi:hypothetical protein GCM10023322_69620 [Rugosimonospora acidiphila]|uniref:PKD domain-containing protein n=1 Tax=Rugosimonospora acidiphila TaxID=556531 RepID=A0ABP9SKV8_9ACTN
MRPFRRLLTFAPVLVVAAATVAWASPAAADPPTTLYVNASQQCNDSGAGTQALPFCSIGAADAVAAPGDTVAIGGGLTFYGSTTITHSGTPAAPITFARYGSFTPQVHGTLTLSGVHDVAFTYLSVVTNTDVTSIQINGSTDVTFDRIQVQQSTPVSARASAISIDGGSSRVTLSRLYMYPGRGPFIDAAPGAAHITITTSEFMASGANAISLSGVADAAVTSNNLTDCGNGIVIDGASTAVVENNVISVGGDTCVGENYGAGLLVSADSLSGVRSDYNAYYVRDWGAEDSWGGTRYQTGAAFHAGTGQGAHDIEIPGYGATTPAEHSPLLDSADANAPGELTTDFTGSPRVDDPMVADTGVGTPTPDRGIYERQDTLTLSDTIDSAQGVAPLTTSITIGSDTGSWPAPITYTVNFGDGGGAVPVAAGGTMTHTYSTPGIYTETTTMTGANGRYTTATHTVTAGTVAPPQLDVATGPTIVSDSLGHPAIVPGDVRVTAVPATDPWEITGAERDIDWGDGSPVGGSDAHEYAHPGTYPVRVTMPDRLGRAVTQTGSATVGDGLLIDSDPLRIYDSRSGGGTDKVPAGGVVRLFLGQPNPYESRADGALVNVTVTNAKSSGFIAVYPDGTPAPATSNVDYAAGQTVANHAVAMAGSNGYVDFYNHSTGPVDLIVDRYGFQKRGTSAINNLPDADTYQPAGPFRLLDTRSGVGAPAGAVASKGTVTFQVAGVNGVPADAAAVVMNLTATDTKSAGYITAYSHGADRPGISNADWAAGQTACSLVVVPLTDGKVTLYNSGPGTADFLADLMGYYNQHGTAAVFLPSAPTRLMDTRSGLGTNGHIAKLQPGQTLTLPVASHIDAPAAGVSAVEVNLTATNPSSTGYITVYPHGAARPTTSSVDFAGGQTAANMTITPVGTDGSIDLYNGGGSTVDLLVDLYGGYYQYPSS